jgi:UDP-glucose 4-epimerase
MHELGWNPEHSSLQEIIQSAWQWKRKQLTLVTSMAGASGKITR